MKLGKLAEVGAKLGAATLVGLNEFRHQSKEEKPRKSFLKSHHTALCSLLIVVGLALWQIKKHHYFGA
jgi:hypothetical protein